MAETEQDRTVLSPRGARLAAETGETLGAINLLAWRPITVQGGIN